MFDDETIKLSGRKAFLFSFSLVVYLFSFPLFSESALNKVRRFWYIYFMILQEKTIYEWVVIDCYGDFINGLFLTKWKGGEKWTILLFGNWN